MTDERRRETDCIDYDGHNTPCEKLVHHIDLETEIRAKLDLIERNQAEMMEMLIMFKNTKGFIITLKWLGLTVVSIAAVGGVIAGALAAFKVWTKG